MHNKILIFTLFFVVSMNLTINAQQNSRKASLKAIIGEVKVRRGSSPKWISARPNMPLRAKDAIRTFVESEATIKTSEGTIIKLGENATFEIQKLTGSSGGQTQTSVKILTGSLAANVKKLVGSKSSFEFETPTAVAAIRGTKLGIDVKDSKTSVKVYEGKVYVKPVGADKGAEVKADQMTTVAKGQKTVKVEKMAAEDKNVDIVKSLDTLVIQDTATVDTAIKAIDTVTTDTTKIDTTEIDTSSKDSAVVEELSLVVSTPVNGLVVFPGALISVSGKVNNATVKVVVNGTEVKPTANGLFKLDIKAPATSGEESIIIEATLGNDNKTVTRNYKIDETLHLNLNEPGAGQSFAPGASIIVTGAVSNGNATVSVNGNDVKPAPNGLFKFELKAPKEPGDYDITVEASLGNKSESLVRTINVSGKLILDVYEPQDGQVIAEPMLKVSGKTMYGAEVTILGSNVPVSTDGSFKIEIPIADEEGDVTIDIEASSGSQSLSKTINVTYEAPKEAIDLIISKPVNGFISCDGLIQISAKVKPIDANVTVNGQSVTNSNGEINTSAKIDDIGDVVFDFEVESERETKTYSVNVTYDPVGEKCNNQVPEVQPSSLPASINQTSLPFTVFDRTKGDQVTFKYTIDGGSLNSESGVTGTRFTLPLEEGKHSYSVWAEDLAGNKSNVVSGDIILMTKAPVITLDEPSTNYKLLHIPPPAPGRSDVHIFDLSFSIDNLPDDNGDLLSEIIVQVKGGETKTKNKFYGNSDFDFSIKLKRGRNDINIIVRDKNNRQVEKPLVIEIR